MVSKIGGPGCSASSPGRDFLPIPPWTHDAAVPDVAGNQSLGQETLPCQSYEDTCDSQI